MESEGDDENQQERQNIIIGGGYDEDYDPLADESNSLNNTNNSNSGGPVVKGRYYKQTYRAAWEHMPDFKGWLRGVQGEPTRAYCVYCQKTLHAHRLSLLKHTCTIRHQKAAQQHNTRKGKDSPMEEIQGIAYQEASEKNEDDEHDVDVNDSMIQYVTRNMDEEQETEEPEEEEESITLETMPMQYQKYRHQITNSMSTSSKPPISTHVLDTTTGTPVNGLQVSLYKLIDGRWTYINEGLTSAEGRFANFVEHGDLSAGRYKMHFDVDRYFELKKQDTLYPFIEVVFDCSGSPNEHYHIPLLLSPFGYTTYRGS